MFHGEEIMMSSTRRFLGWTATFKYIRLKAGHMPWASTTQTTLEDLDHNSKKFKKKN